MTDTAPIKVGETKRAQVAAAVAEILAAADADIAARKPLCQASGRCCKFEAYEHRMYVTGAELMHFAAVIAAIETEAAQAGTGRKVSLQQFFNKGTAEGCPYQVDGLCTAREARPLGCRVYFCDANTQGWQSEVYEKYHARLRALHDRLGLPYRYVEWRAGLRELDENR